jgi:hypothetical protein
MGPDGAPALAELLAQRGYARMQLFQLERAEADLRRGLAVLGDRNPAVANTLRRHLANTLLLAGQREEADREAARSLHDSQRIFGTDHPETGRAWLIYGKTRYYLEDKATAEAAIDRATAIIGSQIGRDHPDLAEALVIRSASAFEEGRLQDAIADARQSLALLERAYGPAHEATLKRRTDVASLLIFSADDERGRGSAHHRGATYREAAGLLSAALADGARQGLPMGYARDEYANVLLHLGRIDEADVQARLGISEMRAQFGPDTTYAAADIMALMKVFTRQGHYDACDALGAWLLEDSAPETASHYSRFLVLAALLENAVARGDPARIRTAYRDVERHARAHGLLDALRALDVPETLRRG